MKTLLVDYSWSNTTAQLATVVQQVTGAERLDLTVAKGTFSNDMYATSDVAQQQLASGDLPALTTPLPDLNQYTCILVGGPVWSGHVATPVRQFLRQLQNYTGTVAPFYTSAGTPGDYEADFASLMPQVSVATGLGLTASDLPNAQSQVMAWWEKMAH